MHTVRQLLESKRGVVVTIAPDASVYQALELMAERDRKGKTPDREEGAGRSISDLTRIQSQLDPEMALVCWLNVAGEKMWVSLRTA